jgi:hypothetical protein
MVRGQQKKLVTPGQNVKRYLTGAQDARMGEVIRFGSEKKNTLSFTRNVRAWLRRRNRKLAQKHKPGAG